VRIQYFSDVHLEFGDCVFPHMEADLIVAAGDIAPGIHALPWLSQARAPVLYVAGNHEYYGGDVTYTLASLRQQAVPYGVHFLERDAFEGDGVRVLGTTLWTDCCAGNREIMAELHRRMNDFRQIDAGGRPLQPDDLLCLHHAGLAWLVEQLGRPYQGKTVVVTHHAPSLLSWHRESNDPLLFGYCNDLEALAERYSIDLWIHGHTHTTHDFVNDGLRVACNARGYYGRDTGDRICPTVAIDL